MTDDNYSIAYSKLPIPNLNWL